MAIIHSDSRCPICGEELDRPYTATSGCAFGPNHRLFKYCDAPLHFDCLETWADREEFSEEYYQDDLQGHRQGGSGTLLFETDKWFLACGPQLSGRLPYSAAVRVRGWPFRLYSKFDHWTEFVSGEFRSDLVGEALRVAESVMNEVKQIVPNTDALIHLLESRSAKSSGVGSP